MTTSIPLSLKSQAAIVLGRLRGLAFQWSLDREGFAVDAAYGELKRNLRRGLGA